MIPRYISALLEGGLARQPRIRASSLDAGALLALDGCRPATAR